MDPQGDGTIAEAANRGACDTSLPDRLRADGLLAIVRGSDPESCVRCVKVLVDHGVRLVEVSLTTTDAFRVIERVANARLDVELGAGTVESAEDAHRARQAGVTYIVTPAMTPGAAAAGAFGMPVLCGCLTPTEMLNAHNLGFVPKLFPASLFGAGYLHALAGPFPTIEVVPVGGIDAATAVEFLRAGALAVGVGSPLVGDAASGGDLAALARRADEYRRVIDRARSS